MQSPSKTRLWIVLGIVSLGLLTAVTAHAARTIPVYIDTDPQGAVVYVDSEQSAPIGTTPLKRVRIARGNHTLIFKKDGYELGKLQVNIRRWKQRISFSLKARAKISVSPGNTGAQGASLKVDGKVVGQLPTQVEVQSGRHLIQVERKGYKPFSQWADLKGGQVMTLPVMLEEQAKPVGSVLVAGDIPGAPIYIDGDPQGVTPSVVDNLAEGAHILEIRPPDAEVFRQEIQVIAGKRITVNPKLQTKASKGGSLRIVANVSGAMIRVDGQDVGQAPANLDDLQPGEHIIEASASGYAPLQETVEVEAGKQKVLSLTLERGAAERSIVVNTDAEGAIVFVDGDKKGPPPVVVNNAEDGVHAILVRAPGYDAFKTTCEIGGSGANPCRIDAKLEPTGAPVRISGNVSGAEVLVDGEPRGTLPWEGKIAVGQHQLEVRAPGYASYAQTIDLEESQQARELSVNLIREATAEEQQAERDAVQDRRMRRSAVTHSAATLPVEMAAIDASIGWPYLGEVRVGVGIFSFLDAGFAIRSFGRLTDFEGRVKASYWITPMISVGGQARFGGGVGPSKQGRKVNSFFLNLEALGSLHLSELGAFTLWVAADMFTDRYDFTSSDDDILVNGGDVGRQNEIRMRLGGAMEFALTRHWNVWALVEGIVVDGDDRRIYGDLFGSGIDDFEVYMRLGGTYKF